MWEEPERSSRLAGRYNELFSSTVLPNHDGDHLTLPRPRRNLHPRHHQRAAVARILTDGRALLAHAVGAGKTATMVMAAMELRRLGSASKPAVVVPNHMLDQFSREWLQLYPTARILVADRDRLSKARRKEFVARAATGDWDGIVFTQSGFARLPLGRELMTDYLGEEIATARTALDGSKDGKGLSVKKLERRIAQMEETYRRLLSEHTEDDGVRFEETGIDYLFVDEAHAYKNRRVDSSIDGVANTGSQRAQDLDSKLWALRRMHGPRVVTFATATPVANSMAELWVMQSYLHPDLLASVDLRAFDAWAANFGRTHTALELAPDGASYRMQTRFARFQNVPELLTLYRQVADVRTNDDLDLPCPGPRRRPGRDRRRRTQRRSRRLRRRPRIPRRAHPQPGRRSQRGQHAEGHRRRQTSGARPPTRRRSATLRGRQVDRGRPADRRNPPRHTRPPLHRRQQPTHPPPRRPAARVLRRLHPRGRGMERVRRTPCSARPPRCRPRLDPLHARRQDRHRQGQALRRCRDGTVAVLVGSTETMGVGTNVQTRAIAMHHLDAPWRPADIEQRDGRILRQGNQNPEVRVLRYVTEGSFDTYMWQTLERKAAFIAQVTRGDLPDRDVDDIGDQALSFAEVKALATGDPLVLEKAAVDADVARLTRLERAHHDDQHRLRRTYDTATHRAEKAEHRILGLEAVVGRITDTRGDRFAMTIDGRSHTKRVDAGEHLQRLLGGQLRRTAPETSGPTVEIGRLGGLTVTAQAITTIEDEVRVALPDAHVEVSFLSNDLTRSDPANLITRLERHLHRLPGHDRRTGCEASDARAEAQRSGGTHRRTVAARR
ncbi:MAG: DEAD/DEAH box helicase family protein [Acidimicrobiia bacterium]|nr:DEAD/DEAH box helicase family protein [Acidimicrobiia bacterium]